MTSKTIFATRVHSDIIIKHIPTSFMCLLIGCRLSISEVTKKLSQNIINQTNKTSTLNEISEDQLKPVGQIVENMFFLKEDIMREHLGGGLKIASALLK